MLSLHENAPGRSNSTFVILGASYVTGNRGVDALLSGTVASILHAAPDAQIVLLDYDRQPATFPIPGHPTGAVVRLANIRFSWKLFLPNNAFRLLGIAALLRALPFRGLRARWLAKNPWLREIQSARLVVSLAGGDSFSDIYGLRRFLYIILPQLLALAVHRPLILLPQTLGPFKSRLAQAAARFIMSRAQIVFARDDESLAAARDVLGPKRGNLRFSPDMAFALQGRVPSGGEPDWLRSRQPDVPLVAVNVSGLLHIGGYSKDNMFALGLDYREVMRSVVVWLTAEAGAHVVLISHVTGPKAGEEDDAVACASLFEAARSQCHGRLHLAAAEYDHREIKHLIGRCDFVIGSRMHATIAALSQGVPAIGLAYSRKFLGVFRSVEVEDLVIDLRNTDTATVLARVQTAFASRADHRRRLQAAAARAAAASEHLIATILAEDERLRRPGPTACKPTAILHPTARSL